MENLSDLNKFKDQNGLIMAYSKWFHNDGTFTWQKCQVINYDLKTERFNI